MTFKTRHTTTWMDRSALQVRLMALSVPSHRNRSRRGASAGLLPWNERPGRCGRGAQAVGRDPPGHQVPVGAIDEPRSARPMDTSSTSQGSLRAGEGMDGGAVDRHAGVLSGFCAPRAKIGYPSTTLTIGCGRHISGPPRIWIEVGPQGVPQTGIIIEVKRRLSGSFFSIPEVLAVLLGVAWLDRMSQERW